MQESMCFSAFLYEYIESIMFLEVASRGGGAIAPLAHPLNPPLVPFNNTAKNSLSLILRIACVML